MIINNRAVHRWPRKNRSSGNRSRSYAARTRYVPSALDEYVRPGAQIPSSTPQSLIFPYDLSTKKFDTSSYSLIKDENRISLEEISKFLKEVSVPIAKFEKFYGRFARISRGRGTIFFILCMIFLPIGFFLLMIASCFEGSAPKEFLDARKKAQDIVSSKSQSFTRRGLVWETPKLFPRWIQLQINKLPPKPAISSQSKSEDATQPGSAGSETVEQGIQIITTPLKSDQEINTVVSTVF